MYSTSEECHRTSELFLFPSPSITRHQSLTHTYTHWLTRYSRLLCIDRCTGSEPGGKHLEELPTQGRTNQHTMSLRWCPKKACHTTADPEGCPIGSVHHCPLSPPAFAFRALGTGHKTPRDTGFDELPSLGPAPVPGLGKYMPPSHGHIQGPTASADTHVKYLVGMCAPKWHVPSLVWSFRQWVPGVKTHRTRDGREHARCRSWTCNAEEILCACHAALHSSSTKLLCVCE